MNGVTMKIVLRTFVNKMEISENKQFLFKVPKN